MIDLLEEGQLYAPLGSCVDAKAVYDPISATDACELAGSSSKLHPISVRDRLAYGLIRKFFWVDTSDMLADGLTKGGIDRTLLHNVANDCTCKCVHDVCVHGEKCPASSATIPPGEE